MSHLPKTSARALFTFLSDKQNKEDQEVNVLKDSRYESIIKYLEKDPDKFVGEMMEKYGNQELLINLSTLDLSNFNKIL